MLNWILDKLSGPVSTVFDAIDHVKDAFRGFVGTLFTIFRLWRDGWSWFLQAATSIRRNLGEFGQDVYALGRHIIAQLLPRWARQLSSALIQLLGNRIRAVRDWAVRRIQDVLDWAARAIGVVRNALDLLTRWARDRIGGLIHWVANVGSVAADLVLHPDKLAKWLLPALWGPLWRFLDSKAVAIGRWLLGRSVPVVLAAADRIDSVLARIL